MTDQILNPSKPILLVDDESSWTHSFSLMLKMKAGLNHVHCCHDSREVLSLLEQTDFSLVLLDLTMPYVSGEALLSSLFDQFPHLPVIILSGINQLETAIRCIKSGAVDFYVKTDETDRVVNGIKRALKQVLLEEENKQLSKALLNDQSGRGQRFPSILTKSQKMIKIFSYLEAVSSSREPLLITGESGVGKELFAREFHHLKRAETPYVAVNAAGLDDMMFSDTLFGHEPGAFTGAERARKGMIEQAANGTLFLDEIGDLTNGSQVKLLRLLQEGEYYPLGSDRQKKTSARIIAATNQNLEEKIERGTFRRDLFFRLKTHRVHIPPLRERREDISLLLNHFLACAAADFNKRAPAASKELMTLLLGYPFPGNVRELRAMAYDAVSTHSHGELSCDSFRQCVYDPAANLSQTFSQRAVALDQIQFPEILPTLKEIGLLLIDEAMMRAQGNQSAAARLLGVTPQALNKRLKQ